MNIVIRKIALSILTAGFVLAAASSEDVLSGVPGSFENAAHPGMDAVIAVDAKIAPKPDEFVVYYVRPDANYAPWALWMWAVPGGDGNSNWKYSQNWSVMDNIAYMRFKLDGSTTGGSKPVSSEGTVGLIVRQKTDWIKDCNDDRIWNTGTSKRCVIFSGDKNTYAAAAYKPSAKSAELVTLNTINMTLTGRYGLALDNSASGFSVVTKKGKEYKIAKVINAESSDNPALNMAKKVTITLDSNVSISDSLIVKNTSFQGDAMVNNTKLAIELAEQTVPASDTTLGCIYKNGSAVFNLWAPTSSAAVLNLYKKDGAVKADYTVPMAKDEKTGVWSVTFSTVDPDGFFYDYTLTNSKGTVTVLDPYARSMAAYRNKGETGRAAVVNMDSAKAMPEGGMDAPYAKLAKREDAVIYEVSVRDFTISPDSGVKSAPGTYKAFIEKIPYLKSLGITHIQLLPVLNFCFTDETNRKYEDAGTVNGNNYNWGYDPHNYFTPEGWYATDAVDPYCRVRELRELINECHKAGLGVILDVVYNHMAGTQFLDDVVPGYYFRQDDSGKLKSASGCGNDTATERLMMKRLVVDSTSYWVKNYKVDGFRFDLMGLMEANSVLDSYNECAKENSSVLFEGEGWKMYDGPSGTFGMDQNYMSKTDKVAVFNDEFRDILKAGGMNETGMGLITKKAVDVEKLFRNCIGSPVVNYKANQPGANLQYLVCHDGLTLHDAVAHNCRLNDSDAAQKAEITKRMKLGNFFALTSQGIAFLYNGQESGRTKPNVNHVKNESVGDFVRNSYDSSDNINQFIWTLDAENAGLLEYTKGLAALRAQFDVFRIGDAAKLAKNAKLLKIKDDSSLIFGYTIKNGDGTWIIAVNASKEAAELPTGLNMAKAVVYADADKADVNGIAAPTGVTMGKKAVKLEPLMATVIRINK